MAGLEGKGLRATHWSSVFWTKNSRTIFKSVVSDLADGNEEAVELKSGNEEAVEQPTRAWSSTS